MYNYAQVFHVPSEPADFALTLARVDKAIQDAWEKGKRAWRVKVSAEGAKALNEFWEKFIVKADEPMGRTIRIYESAFGNVEIVPDVNKRGAEIEVVTAECEYCGNDEMWLNKYGEYECSGCGAIR